MATETTEWFEVAQGAPPGTEAAFHELTSLIFTQPTLPSAVFNAQGELTDDQLAALREKIPAGDTPSQRFLNLLDTILYEQFDLETEFGEGIDSAMRHWLTKRHESERPSERARRLKRLELYLSRVAIAAQVKS